MINPEYLNNKNFLKALDEETHREQYIRIEVLKFKDETLDANIEGKATGGSCTLSGKSNMRRVASCSLIVDPEGITREGCTSAEQYYNIAEVENLISLNKKVRIYTGFTNTLTLEYPQYANYDIIWFPLGTYVIKSANISRNNSGINISLTLNDKTALLNGDMGGIIPAATILSEIEVYNATGTSRSIEKILIKDLIKYLVVDFGGEDPENVIITDIPDYITKIMKWNGKTDLYIHQEEDDGGEYGIQYQTKKANGNDVVCKPGEDIGYVAEPFVYPGKLECSAGESVSSLLSKIANTLGNYEWFYDVQGKFHFQEKKNYINTSITKKLLELSDSDYLSFANLGKAEYVFNNQKIITSISSSPQYENIKNDYIVWGTTKTATGADKPIRYHLTFATKPPVSEQERECLVYKDYRGLWQVVVVNDSTCVKNSKPTISSDRTKYYIDESGDIYHWDDSLQTPGFRTLSTTEIEHCYLKTEDWRTELYFLGLEADNKTFAKNYYAAELNSEWPKIYDVKKTDISSDTSDTSSDTSLKHYLGGYKKEDAASYEYWLDFIEGDADCGVNVSQFNVDTIGRRSKVVLEKSANCIFPIDYSNRNYLLIEANGDTQKAIEMNNSIGGQTVQVAPEIWNKMSIGGSKTSAYEKIKELIFTHTNYNESINLSVIPIYYLEPNTRISVEDNKTGIKGDYLISSITLPLTTNGTSTISATKCLERTI